MQPDNLLDEINDSIPASDFEAEYYLVGMVQAGITITAQLAHRPAGPRAHHRSLAARGRPAGLAAGLLLLPGALAEASRPLIR